MKKKRSKNKVSSAAVFNPAIPKLIGVAGKFVLDNTKTGRKLKKNVKGVYNKKVGNKIKKIKSKWKKSRMKNQSLLKT